MSSEEYGMKTEQEPKYTTNADGRIVNRASGEAIPDDEPVFIFRARDRHAAAALLAYLQLCDDPDHLDAVQKRIGHFRLFAEQYPERMKEPDSP